MTKTYAIKSHRTAADVAKNNVEVLGRGYTLEDAARVAQLHMKTGWFVSVWIEAEETNQPRIVRSIERDHTGARYTVTRCDGWHI